MLSGIQPSGHLTLGNYLGAIRNWVQKQDEYDTLFMLVDLHSITVRQDPAALRERCYEFLCLYMACGLDPSRNTLFVQSHVPAHSELAWLLNCYTYVGELNRMTQFKEKAGKNRENASVGLYAYPNLMAADILAYQATHVPVGEDQKQHLELSRDIAQKFNNDFGEQIVAAGYADGLFFPQPEPVITGPATRVMSLRDGTKKMSKSDPSEYSRIALTDDADAIALKFRKARTDPEPLPSEVDGLKGRAEADNLVGIFAALADQTKEQVLSDFGGSQFSVFKPALADLAVARMAPIASEMRRLLADPGHIDSVLTDGAEGEFGLEGDAELAHDEHVEWGLQRLGDLKAHRHAAPRQAEDHDVLAA